MPNDNAATPTDSGQPEDFDPIWEATVHGELDPPVDESDYYDGDEW